MYLIRTRHLAAGLLLALAATLGLLAFSEVAHQRAQAGLAHLEEAAGARGTLLRVLVNWLALESTAREYLQTGSAGALEEFLGSRVAVAEPLGLLGDLPGMGFGSDAGGLLETVNDSLRQQLSRIDGLVIERRQHPHLQSPSPDALNSLRDGSESLRLQASRLIDEASLRFAIGQAEVERALWMSRVGLALAVVTALGGFWLYRWQSRSLARARERAQQALRAERDRLELEVRERTSSLSELAEYLTQVREEERARLANELHDELGALLTTAKLDLARLKRRIDGLTGDAGDLFVHLQTILNEGIALKRRIIEDLRPSSLANLGLEPALEILTREFAQRSGLEVEVHLVAPRLVPATELTVFRLVQEALTNVARHAQAQRVTVVLREVPLGVEVSVTDDGKGFRPLGSCTGSHGLTGMRHRVEVAGGQLEVESEPGRGTRVRACLPADTSPGLPARAALPEVTSAATRQVAGGAVLPGVIATG